MLEQGPAIRVGEEADQCVLPCFFRVLNVPQYSIGNPEHGALPVTDPTFDRLMVT